MQSFYFFPPPEDFVSSRTMDEGQGTSHNRDKEDTIFLLMLI